MVRLWTPDSCRMSIVARWNPKVWLPDERVHEPLGHAKALMLPANADGRDPP
jgi:hypothetical protein